MSGLLRTRPADEAMRMWLDRFVDFMTTKRDMGDALRTVIASGGNQASRVLDLIMDGLRYRTPAELRYARLGHAVAWPTSIR